MTITELPSTEHITNSTGEFDPYNLDLKGPEAKFLLDRLSAEVRPYVDAQTNPDIGNRTIYLIDGSSKFSDLARALEGDVYNQDWKQERQETKEDAKAFEQNSIFFLMTDETEAGKQVIGTLRIADCNRGNSETQDYYKKYFNTDTLPEEIALHEGREGVWDIVGVAVTNDPAKRTGLESAWLYYAMHRRSTELSINKWISNITVEEIRNLREFIGIPFEEISTQEKAHILDGKGEIVKTLGFYAVDAKVVAPTVEANIEKLSGAKGVKRFIAQIAMIGLWGSTSKPPATIPSKMAS